MTPIEYLLSGKTGTSSKTILAVMTNSNITRPDVPYDGGDFGRCYKMLKEFPEWRDRLSEVAEKHKEWSAIVPAWSELTELYLQNDHKSSHMLYERLQELIEEGRLSAGWKKTGPGSWQGPSFNETDLGGMAIRTDC